MSQSKQHRSAELRMIPIGSIEVLNTRERNHRVFHEIVGNIRDIGLKKPITVTPRPGANGGEHYLLICGEGRLKAYKSLKQDSIPALVNRATRDGNHATEPRDGGLGAQVCDGDAERMDDLAEDRPPG